jgi:molecular chaperone GrpE
MADEDATGSKPKLPSANGPAASDAEQSVPGAAASDTTTAPRPEPPEASEAGPSELEQLRSELAATKDRWLRERAELENFKKRLVREKAEALRFANEGLVRDLLPVIDNLHRAVEHGCASREVDPIIEGVELVLRAFTEALERHGVQVVEARGQRFDPSQHEAIGHVESEQPPNTVVDEHQRGYTLHERLLRPALVTVGKGPAPGRLDVEKVDDDD